MIPLSNRGDLSFSARDACGKDEAAETDFCNDTSEMVSQFLPSSALIGGQDMNKLQRTESNGFVVHEGEGQPRINANVDDGHRRACRMQ
jgi:hypothetical protein